MQKTLLIATPLLLSTTLTPAHAASPEGRFAVKGAGITRCAHYVEQVEGKTREFYAYAGWLEGYLTATNGYQKNTFDIAPWQNTELLALMLANHCRRNPQEPYALAVRKLVQALYPSRLEKPSELVVARSDDKGIRLYRETVRRLQSRLSELGLYKGEINGNYDRPTRAAVIAFQEREQLPRNGLPDAATLLRLFKREKENKK